MSNVIDLSTLAATQGLKIIGGAEFSVGAVSIAGDVNGDGIADIIVGAQGTSTTDINANGIDDVFEFGAPQGPPFGAAFVIYGKSGENLNNLVNLTNLAVADGFRIVGAESQSRTGASVSSGGDVNSDGITDIFIGAPGSTLNGDEVGRAYVVYGQLGTTRGTLTLATLSASEGFDIVGPVNSGYEGELGSSIAGGLDVNGDGIGDIVVGAPRIDGTYVIYGQSGATRGSLSIDSITVSEGYAINGFFGFGGGDDVGASVAVGDVNKDGIADIVIGAPRANHGGYPPPASGDAYVIYGVAGTGRTLVNATAVTPSEGFVIQIDDLAFGNVSDGLGSSVAVAGDVNGDGIGDIIISASGNDDGGDTAGKAFVVYGQFGATRGRLNVFNISPSDGFSIQGDADYDSIGFVSAAGDINGDGYADIIVGATGGDDGGTNAGEAYVILGQSSSLRGPVDLTGLVSSDGFIIRGDSVNDLAGFAVSGGGDVNYDSIIDIIVSAPRDTTGGIRSGSAYVIYGGAPFSSLLNPVLGTPGIDTLFNPATNDEINGLASVDTLDMSSYALGITLNTVTGIINSPEGGSDVVLSIEEFNLGSGDDTVTLGNSGFVVRGNDGSDVITGGTARDLISGGGGNDILAGGTGAANELAGGSFDDLYIVSVAGDTIIEAVFGGNDTIETTVATFTNRANVETLRFTNNAAHTGIGIAQNETLIGNTGADGLFGRAGDDILAGGSGAANTLVGGLGDDAYYLETLGDTIVEAFGEGIDSVVATVASHTLKANVENLTGGGSGVFTGIGNVLGNILTGGSAADFLSGLGGNDVLQGGAGAANTLVGGQGDDIYMLTTAGDSTIEAVGEGIDSVITNQASHTLKANVENLTGGSGGAFTGSGNAIGNAISGGSFDDFLSGLDGDDVLTGGSGMDFLIGGNGADTFRIDNAAQVDRVFDFVSGVDKIALEGAVFAHTAVIDYVAGTVATSTNSTFLYNSGNGILSYDADGTGSGAAVAIANMGGGAVLSVGDFMFY